MAPYVQDSAPAGGYGPIQWQKEFIPKRVNGYLVIGAFLGVKAVALAYYALVTDKNRLVENVEENDSRLALQPLFEAEMDRNKLRHLRACRDEEAHLMRNDPEWRVGNYYGQDRYSDDSNIFRRLTQANTSVFEERSLPSRMYHRSVHLINQIIAWPRS